MSMLLSATAAADKPLKRVVRKLPPRLVAAVAKSSLHTCRELLALGEHELVDRLDLYIPEVRSIVLTVSKAVAKPRTALALLSPPPTFVLWLQRRASSQRSRLLHGHEHALCSGIGHECACCSCPTSIVD